MENTVAAYGLYPNAVEVVSVVRTLNDAGFDKESICLLIAPTHPIAAVVRDANILNEERAASAVTAGLIGWLSEFGAVVIPSIGFFIRSQAFLRALLAARDAPALCGNFRTLTSLGFQDREAEQYEAQLAHTGFLVYVTSSEAAKAIWARELLHRTGAEESATLEREADTEVVA